MYAANRCVRMRNRKYTDRYVRREICHEEGVARSRLLLKVQKFPTGIVCVFAYLGHRTDISLVPELIYVFFFTSFACV